jgi:pyrroline-5-carboxylate reductase
VAQKALKRIGLIGAGEMATALIQGLIASGYPAHCIRVSDISPKQLEEADKNVIRYPSNNLVLKDSDAVTLAVLKEIRTKIGTQKPLISIASGLRLETIESQPQEGASVIRIMPSVRECQPLHLEKMSKNSIWWP